MPLYTVPSGCGPAVKMQGVAFVFLRKSFYAGFTSSATSSEAGWGRFQGEQMTNYPGIHILNSLAGAASAAQGQDAEAEDPYMVMTSETMAKSVFANPVGFEITDITEV